jgi:hypothetical protein
MNTQTHTPQAPRVYSLFNASGKVEEIKPVPELPYGCKVYIFGAGMSEHHGAICSAPNEHGTYKVVKISDFEDRQGFATLDKYARPLSKQFGIGVYYADNLETYPAEVVQKYIDAGEVAERNRKQAAQEQAEKDKQERTNLPKLYPHLTQNPQDDHKTTKGNLIAELKKNFPAVKFSVTKRHYSSYNVEWTNGPTREQVAKITGKFEDHETDFTGDFRDYSPSNFNRVFGGFKYVFENRNISAEISTLLPQLVELLADYKGAHPEEIFRRILSRTPIPANAQNFRIERTELTCGQIEDFYCLVFDAGEDTTPAPVTGGNGAQIRVNEQKNGIEVIFPTKPAAAIIDALKSNGFRWSRFGGLWYHAFTPERLETIKTALS